MAELFPALAERDMGFLAIRPLMEGVLTNNRPSQEALADDHRLTDPRHAPTFRERTAVADAFKGEIGRSMTRFALRFPLCSPLVASIIVGLYTPQQVEAVTGMMDGIELRPELVERAMALWRDGGATG